MLVKLNVVLKSPNGDNLMDNDGKGNAIDATLKNCIVNALFAPVQDEKGIDKVKKYDLAMKCYKNDEIDLTPEEMTLIRERVGIVFPSPLVVGQIFELLK